MGGNTEAQREDEGSRGHLACRPRAGYDWQSCEEPVVDAEGEGKEHAPVACR